MTTKTEPSQAQKLVEEIARLKGQAEIENEKITGWQDMMITARKKIDRITDRREALLQQAFAKEAELKRLLETLEP